MSTTATATLHIRRELTSEAYTGQLTGGPRVSQHGREMFRWSVIGVLVIGWLLFFYYCERQFRSRTMGDRSSLGASQ